MDTMTYAVWIGTRPTLTYYALPSQCHPYKRPIPPRALWRSRSSPSEERSCLTRPLPPSSPPWTAQSGGAFACGRDRVHECARGGAECMDSGCMPVCLSVAHFLGMAVTICIPNVILSGATPVPYIAMPGISCISTSMRPG